ncbi:MAG: glycosyltransferase [Ardenticatenia bacterium]|nr:glycosyltransferase [Ardenticatenia bacterium]
MGMLIALYTAVVVLLSLYGAHALVMVCLHLRGRRRTPSGACCPQPTSWPQVTVQLPVYNERYVIIRLIDAVARLDYPADRLEIQVLDDSTDATTRLAARRVQVWQQRGVNIRLIRRDRRVGYKAGALQHGLATASGDLIAIFDADFVPPPDWLRRTVPVLVHHPEVGIVQTRWEHLNADLSALTRAQALALDGHFGVEQPARAHNGLLLNFNGSAGLWRRRCIEEAGGWRSETLSEDLDLSYRAQLRGWRVAYLPDVTAPAEIPPRMTAFKRQQFRWAKGSAQCVRLLAGPLARSSLPLHVRLLGLLHLTGYFIHPGMVVLLLLTLPLLLSDKHMETSLPPAWLGLLGLSAPLLYLAAQHALRPDWKRRALCCRPSWCWE